MDAANSEVLLLGSVTVAVIVCPSRLVPIELAVVTTLQSDGTAPDGLVLVVSTAVKASGDEPLNREFHRDGSKELEGRGF